MSENKNELPKNLPEDIGRDKNIVSMSETAGERGDVMSKIGIGLDANFEGGERRRHPKSHGLLKGLLTYFSAAILVIGSEGDGMSRIVREKCDFIVSLKMKGQINSLNASVAGGILMYEFAYKR